MFTPIGFYNGWKFGGVPGAKFAYEAQSTTEQGLWIDTSGNGFIGNESAETNNGITHVTDPGGNYWEFDETNASNFDSNFVSTGFKPGSMSGFTIHILQNLTTPPYDVSGSLNSGPAFVCSTVNDFLDLFMFTEVTGSVARLNFTIDNNTITFNSNTGSSGITNFNVITLRLSFSRLFIYVDKTLRYNVINTNKLDAGTESIDLHRLGRGATERGTRPTQKWQLGAFVFYEGVLSQDDIFKNVDYFRQFY
jgi:hypothetical protein